MFIANAKVNDHSRPSARSNTLHVRVDEQMMSELMERADDMGVTISDVVRDLIDCGLANIKATKNGHLKTHRTIWSEHHGPIPAGHIIHHINGNHYDNRIGNLMAVTMGQHSRLHMEMIRRSKPEKQG